MASILDDKRSFYEILGVEKSATTAQIRRAYRLLALRVHPDRNQGNERATQEFQRLNVIHETLTNERARKRYDRTGEIDEEASAEFETAYEHYRKIFREITREDIDAYAEKYRNSDEEREDVFTIYTEAKGDMQVVMDSVPLCTSGDLPRFKEMIADAIEAKKLKFKRKFQQTADKVTFLNAESEAEEAEKLRKELLSEEENAAMEDDGENALKSLILKRKANRSSFLDDLESKYGGQNDPNSSNSSDSLPSEKKTKKTAKKGAKSSKSGGKGAKSAKKATKAKKSAPKFDEIDDAEFEKIQAKLMKNKKKAKR